MQPDPDLTPVKDLFPEPNLRALSFLFRLHNFVCLKNFFLHNPLSSPDCFFFFVSFFLSLRRDQSGQPTAEEGC